MATEASANSVQFLNRVREALAGITDPHWYRDERAFQGQLLVQLSAVLRPGIDLPNQAIIQQEYQKRADLHGITYRPDVVIHIPFDAARMLSRRVGNLAVIELKLRASQAAILDELRKLAEICIALDYAYGIVINVDAAQSFLAKYEGPARERLHEFAVRLTPQGVQIQEAA